MSENTTRISSDELDALESQTDWDRLESLTDEEIASAIQDDPDTVALDREWFELAEYVDPTSEKTRVTIRLDANVVDYFKAQGKGYQTRINDVLRTYVVAQKVKQAERAQK